MHKEGLFVRVYEHSSYMFAKHIKEYIITKKFYKNVKQEVVYLGFLQKSLSKIEGICKDQNLSLKQENNHLKITNFTEKEIVTWKNKTPLNKVESIVENTRYQPLKENIIFFCSK